MTAGRFSWGNETHLTADQIQAEHLTADGDKSRLEEAKEFLQEILASGPVNSNEVFNQARDAGINQSTLKRAKTALAVKARKQSFDRGWQWELPGRSSIGPQGARSDNVNTLGDYEQLRPQ